MRIEIAPDGAPPAEQVYGQVRGLITSGQLAADERLPSVRQLAADLGLAVGTVAKAYRRLESDGLVESRTGAGTRVSRAATPVSREVARAARALASAARREGLSAEDAVRIVRAMW